jgi:hypothetical protein
MKCETCGTEKKALFSSLYCPKDCDLQSIGISEEISNLESIPFRRRLIILKGIINDVLKGYMFEPVTTSLAFKIIDDLQSRLGSCGVRDIGCFLDGEVVIRTRQEYRFEIDWDNGKVKGAIV